ncbi:uncharacterized protein [Rutidosis leptorrhynchoides]|uniref:uncharacterized protein n=1 Tax=Rutidosis leptorrhynchoides TaxID=125765 RepID=UPI003A99677F
MAIILAAPAVLLIYLSFIFRSTAVTLIDEIRDAELKVLQLESILAKSVSVVDTKNKYIKESEKLVEEMTSEVDRLQSVLLIKKNKSSSAYETFNQLEEEVRLLWTTARRNNFELHNLESKAQDAEERLEITKSRVEMMAGVVTEQWIQIQHLEQALVIAEIGLKDLKRIVSRCPFLKFVNNKFGYLLDDYWKIIEKTWSAVKQNHHQLQKFVKKEMQKWKYTAAFANKEVVFFVASALITFPALSVGAFLLNGF